LKRWLLHKYLKIRTTLPFVYLCNKASLVYKDSDFSENNPDQNKRLINASVNLFWTPVEKVDLGVEYTYGKRETFSNLEGKLSRINLLGRYNF
ncbi:DcaP family trimeric outer membrane transporter, partial [Acinetobacter baumannii]|uniref:DcaP family trimeric outer membrane transporter n=1 Tax=Acinetobacter baumannii TaxID=470 RepID=UPI002248B9A1